MNAQTEGHEAEQPLALLIAGMHRSGTSALARVLSYCGFALPRTLMHPGFDNPKGFWESAPISDLQDAMLRELGSEWADSLVYQHAAHIGDLNAKFGARARDLIVAEMPPGQSIVFKDPRISLFLPFWLDQLGGLGYACRVIIPFRNPVEVAASLYKRQGLLPQVSYLLWLSYLLSAEQASRSCRRSLLRYSDLLEDWRTALGRVAANTGILLRPAPEMAAEIDHFLDGSDRHHWSEPEALASSDAPLWIKDAYQLFSQACESDDFPDPREIDTIGKNFWVAGNAFAPIMQELNRDLVTARTRIEDGERQALIVDEQLRVERSASAGTIARLSGSRARTASRLNSMRQRMADLSGSRKALQFELSESLGRQAVADSDLARAKAKVYALEQEQTALMSALTFEQKRASAIFSQLSEKTLSQKRTEETLAACEQELAVLAVEISELRDAFADEKEKGAALQKHVAELTEQLSSEKQQGSALRREKQALQEQHDWSQREASKFGDDNRRLAAIAADRLASLVKGASEQRLTFAHIAHLEHEAERDRTDLQGARSLLDEQMYYIRNHRSIWARLRRRMWRSSRLRIVSDVLHVARQPSVRHRQLKAITLLRSSDLFDEDFYLQQAWRVDAAGCDPVWDYVVSGLRSLLDPSPGFSTASYLEANPDVAIAEVNPLVHYIRHGREEGRLLASSRSRADAFGLVSTGGKPLLGDTQSSLVRRACVFIERYRLDQADQDLAGALAALQLHRNALARDWAPTVASIILLPADNAATLLSTLDALLRQSVAETVEILLLNSEHCSLIEPWADRIEGLRVVGSADASVADNLDEALQAACGPYIFMMPAANLLDPLCLETLIDAARSPAAPDLVLPAMLVAAHGEVDGAHFRHAFPSVSFGGRMALFSRTSQFAPAVMRILAARWEGGEIDSELSKNIAEAKIWCQPQALWGTLDARQDFDLPLEPQVRKQVRTALVVDARHPQLDRDAGSLACENLISELQSRGYHVRFLAQDEYYHPGIATRLERLGVEVVDNRENSPEIWLRAPGEDIDLCVLIRVGVAEKMLPLVRKMLPHTPILFHAADLHFLREQRQAELEKDQARWTAAVALKKKELDIIAKSDVTIVHSDFELNEIKTHIPDAKVVVLPFMLEMQSAINSFQSRRNILFLGAFSHPPNVDAVQYFAENIWPGIHTRRNDINFIIAGSDMPEQIEALNRIDGVRAVGFVPDLRELFERVRLSIAPLRFGAGAKGKVAVSLAHGVPAILSPIAAEGMGLVDRRGVLICEDPQAWVDSILEIYDDERSWNEQSHSAQVFAKENYAPGNVKIAFDLILSSAESDRRSIQVSL